jgi:hypothetical protein
MRVSDVGDLVHEWIDLHGQHLPGFCGAYLFGSIATMPPDAQFAPYRDVDLIVVLDTGTRTTDENLEVFYKGLMLEVGFIGLDEHRDAEDILARPDRAGTMAKTRILADPMGILTPLQLEVRRSYTEPQWIAARCRVEKQALLDGLDAMLGPPVPLPRFFALVQVVFSMAGLLAVARLEMPTSRRALIRLKQHLDEEERADVYAEILDMCGVATLTSTQVRTFHSDMMSAFDRAVEVKRTVLPYSFKFEIHTRSYANEAIVEMIDEGFHREAAFYLGLPYGGANNIIQHDAPEAERAEVQAGYDNFLESLDLIQPRDWSRRIKQARTCADEVIHIVESHEARRHGGAR